MIDRLELATYLFFDVLVAAILLAEPIHKAWSEHAWRVVDGKFVRDWAGLRAWLKRLAVRALYLILVLSALVLFVFHLL